MKIPIFISICGSIAQGTSSPQSDQDKKAIYITDEFECHKEYEKQTEHWELKKFLNSCRKGIPFELETLYAPKRCWLISLPQSFQRLIDDRIFVTQDTINMYFYCAQWKQRQSGGKCNKISAHSIRYLLEIKHMLQNNTGPRVDVGDHKEMLMQIKIGKTNVDVMKGMYNSLWKETQQLPIDHLPVQADVDAIERESQWTIQRYQHQ